jgi:hypothetical protein
VVNLQAFVEDKGIWGGQRMQHGKGIYQDVSRSAPPAPFCNQLVAERRRRTKPAPEKKGQKHSLLG